MKLDHNSNQKFQKLADFLYKEKFGKSISWEDPQDLNEKINWLAFKTDTTEWAKLADKYLVRTYIKRIGLEDILTKI